MEIKGTSDVGALSHHILLRTWQPSPKTFLFLKKATVESLWFVIIKTYQHTQALLSTAVFATIL